MPPPASPRVVAAALGCSAAGHVVHNLAELPVAVLWAPATVLPLGVTLLLGVALWRRPGRASFAAAGGWALLVIVGGGSTVLPLDALPFVPEPTVGHYATHLGYALAQLPLLWVAARGVRRHAAPSRGVAGGGGFKRR